MKAYELIDREFQPSEGVHFDVDEETGYIVKADKAEWTVDENGPRVMVSYDAGDLANFDGEVLAQRYEWILPPDLEVHIIDNPWQQEVEEGFDREVDCEAGDCVFDCTDECAFEGFTPDDPMQEAVMGLLSLSDEEHEVINSHYTQPASREEYSYEDYDGDLLTLGATVVPDGELAVSIDSDDTIIAVPRGDVPELIQQLLEKVGVRVTDIHFAEDHDYQEHEYIGSVEVLGGATHPAGHPATMPTECILADLAFLAQVYQTRARAEFRERVEAGNL